MIPLSDGVPVQRFPLVNAALIAANFAVFLFYELPDQNAAISHASFYPCSVENACSTPLPWGVGWITAMFLHAGWGHILGNMWFLAVFGKNVEDAFGRLGYLIFYFAAGFVATMVQTGMTLISTASHTGPTLGASGALAAVMGAYLVLYPNSRVFLLVRWFPIRIHAWFYLGGWFLYQFIVGNYGLIHSKSGGSGIAFFAHIGGFIFGVLVALALIRAGRFRIPEAGWHGRWTHRS
jgi:membrane associated rhomboid family serine protease